MEDWEDYLDERDLDIEDVREAAEAWSYDHSLEWQSNFNPEWDDQQVVSYYDAFVEYHPNHDEHLDALYDFLVDEMGYYDADEWDDKYEEV